MVKRGNLRIEKYTDISATVPTKIADENPQRWKMRIKTDTAAGFYIGVDEAVNSDTAYWLDTLEELRVEKYKGPVWALAHTTSANVFVYEESEERR